MVKKNKVYHVATNGNKEEWLEKLTLANKLFNKWKKEFGVAVMYEEVKDKKGSLLSEKRIKSFGKYTG